MPQFTVFRGSADGSIMEGTTARELGPKDVLVQITCSGICNSDLNYRNQDMVLGHEGAGVVSQIGETVTKFQVGQRCGWGYQHSSCGHCKQCLQGAQTFCPQKGCYAYANRDQGSFGTAAVWSEDWLFAIPDDLPSEHAAPLMCAGSTVWSALQLYPVKATDRVGIVGLGGLGHIAVQFAHAFGCEVVVFSSTESKRQDAMKLGATEFYTATKGAVLEIGKPLDRLLATSSKQPDWETFLPLMNPHGVLYPLTIAFDNLSVPYLKFVLMGLRLQGATVSSIQAQKEMIEFAARHKIKPWIEEFPMTVDGITTAMDQLKNGHTRYRAVLQAEAGDKPQSQ